MTCSSRLNMAVFTYHFWSLEFYVTHCCMVISVSYCLIFTFSHKCFYCADIAAKFGHSYFFEKLQVLFFKDNSVLGFPTAEHIQLGTSKYRVLSCGTLSQTLNFENFATASPSCCQQIP